MIKGITEQEHEKAVKALSEAVNKFNSALDEAEAIADKYGLDFYIQPAYAMGGSFEGQGDNEDSIDSWTGRDNYGWQASSQSC